MYDAMMICSVLVLVIGDFGRYGIESVHRIGYPWRHLGMEQGLIEHRLFILAQRHSHTHARMIKTHKIGRGIIKVSYSIVCLFVSIHDISIGSWSLM